MKVLFVNSLDIVGGAAIATNRLKYSLENFYNIESLSIVDVSKTTSYALPKNMKYARNSIFKKAFEDKINKFMANRGYLYTYLPFAKKNIKNIVNEYRPDVIILNNIHGGFFEISLIEELSKKTPIIWTLHDMWAITGKCEYSYDCDKWESGCGACPYLDNYPPTKKDKTAYLWKLKEKVYKNSNIKIVAPSKWLYKLANRSKLFQEKEIYNIPYSINLDVFQKLNKEVSKEALGIDKNSKVLMFAPYDVTIWRKGFDILLESLKHIDDKLNEKVTLLMVGNRQKEQLEFKNFIIKEIGFVQNEQMLAICYNSADIFLLPSRNDNYPLVLMEAVSCGTPCITFDIGGCGEIVENGKNGYAVKPFDVHEYANKIYELLINDNLLNEFSENCVNFARETYSIENSTKKYYELLKC